MSFLAITIDLNSALVLLLSIAGLGLIITLIVLFAKLIQTLNKVNSLVGELHEPITKTVVQLPDLVTKVDQVVDDVSQITDSAAETVPDIVDDVAIVSDSVSSVVESLSSLVLRLSGGLDNLFRPKKKSFDLGAIIDIAKKTSSVFQNFQRRKARRKRK